MSMMKEFREFAMRGNLVDIAVAFVMGVAFARVVSSFIDGMVMPVIGKIVAGVDFNSLRYVLSEAQFDADGNEILAEASIKYGEFITILIDFILVAFIVFMLIRTMNKLRKKEAASPAPPPAPTEDQKLLAEIRDLLRKESLSKPSSTS